MGAVKVKVLEIYDELVRGFCIKHKRKPLKPERDKLFDEANLKFDKEQERENGATRTSVRDPRQEKAVHGEQSLGLHRQRRSFWHL